MYTQSQFVLSANSFSGNIKIQAACVSNGPGRLGFMLFSSNGSNGLNGYLIKYSAVNGEHPGQILRLDNGVATDISTYKSGTANSPALKGAHGLVATYHVATNQFQVTVNGNLIAVAKDAAYVINGPVGYGAEIVTGTISKFLINGHQEILVAVPVLPDVTNLTATVSKKKDVLMQWSAPNGLPKGAVYEIRQGTTWAGGTVLYRTSDVEKLITDPPVGSVTYWVGVRDLAGNYSPNPPSVTGTLSAGFVLGALATLDSVALGSAQVTGSIGGINMLQHTANLAPDVNGAYTWPLPIGPEWTAGLTIFGGFLAPDGSNTAYQMDATAVAGANFFRWQNVPYVDGQTYTFSVWARSVSGSSNLWNIGVADQWANMPASQIIPSAWTPFSGSFTYHSSWNATYTDLFRNLQGTIQIWQPKVEAGNVATGWTGSLPEIITSQGTAANIANQGALAVQNSMPQSYSALNINPGSGHNINITAAPGLVVQNSELSYAIPSPISLTLNTQGSGVDGLDTGTFAFPNIYYVHVIYNPTTGSVNSLMSLSATSPTLPSGYTYFRLVSFLSFTAGNVANGFNQNNEEYWFQEPIQVTTVTSAVEQTYSLANIVPPFPWGSVIHFGLGLTAYTSGSVGCAIATQLSAPYTGGVFLGSNAAQAVGVCQQNTVVLLNSQSIYAYKVGSGSGTPALWICGLRFNL